MTPEDFDQCQCGLWVRIKDFPWHFVTNHEQHGQKQRPESTEASQAAGQGERQA